MGQYIRYCPICYHRYMGGKYDGNKPTYFEKPCEDHDPVVSSAVELDASPMPVYEKPIRLAKPEAPMASEVNQGVPANNGLWNLVAAAIACLIILSYFIAAAK